MEATALPAHGASTARPTIARRIVEVALQANPGPAIPAHPALRIGITHLIEVAPVAVMIVAPRVAIPPTMVEDTAKRLALTRLLPVPH